MNATFRMKNIDTLIMNNNWLGKEASLAEEFKIKYQQFSSYYNEEKNETVIDYVHYTEEQLPAWGI